MNAKKLLILAGIIVVVFLIFLLLGPFYVVNEGSQVVITRFGRIINTRTDAGLYFKLPFTDMVTVYPKRILSLDGDSQRIPTKENQFIIVDTTSRWRISDPKLFYQNFKTLDVAYNRLSDIIDSSVRTIITQNRLSEIVRSSNIINERKNTGQLVETDGVETSQIEELLTQPGASEAVQKGRMAISNEMADEARKMLPEYGVELLDIVPRQIKYSDELTESVYNRMIKERSQVAQAYRSLGEGKKAEWLGRLENEKRTISSQAYKKAEELKGLADAEAAAIYAQAYQKDPEFYTFWKSLESYKTTMPDFDTLYSTDMEYFKYMYNSRGRE